MSERVTFELPDAVVEEIAVRAAAIVVEQLATVSARPDSPYLTVEEAAEYLRCGYDEDGNVKRQAVDDLLSRGMLTRVKLGRRTLIDRAEIEAYLARQTSRRGR